MNRAGIIYIAENLVNGKCYVGKTIRGFDKRIISHLYSAETVNDAGYNYYFHRAIRFHGADNFIWKIIDEGIQLDELNWCEMFYISYFNTFGPRGYNTTKGGDGCLGYRHTDEAKKAISNGLTGIKRSSETCKRISVSKTGRVTANIGRRMTEEQKRKLSIANTGRVISEETKIKIGNASRGRKCSEAAKQKISRANSGENNGMYGVPALNHGIPHSPETRLKMSAARKGKPSSMKGKHHTEASKKKISDTKAVRSALDPNYGKHPETSFQKGMVPWNKGLATPEETRRKQSKARMGKEPANKGQPMSKEQKLKVSIAKGGKPFEVYTAGVLVGSFININQCAVELGLDRRKVSACLHGHRKSHKGYTFRYAD